MSRVDADKALVTFQDVAACFSEEQWRLLHEWQKELYRTVMKEIHQALNSMGYGIVNTNTLLRIYTNKEVFLQDPHNPLRKAAVDIPASSYHFASHLDISGIKPEGELDCRDPFILDETGFSNSSSPACHFTTSPDIILRIKQEEELECGDPYSLEETGFSNSSSPEYAITTLIIKEEEDRFSEGPQDSERRKSIHDPIGDGTMGDVPKNRKKKADPFVKCTEKALCKASSGTNKTKVLQSSENGMHSMSQPFSESSQEQEGKKTTLCKSVFSNMEHFYLHDGTAQQQKVAAYECANNAGNKKLSKSQQNTHRNLRLYTCTECEKSFNQKGHFTAHKRTHTGERPYQCADCGKRFCQKNNLTRHQRIHTGYRPHQCTQCEKSFTRHGTLIIHLRKHTGERPYQCTECDKTFCQKINLTRHQRAHTML